MALGSYEADPALVERVFDLIELSFGPGIPKRRAAARRWGLRWDRCSVPFVREVDGRVMAHVGVMAIPAVLEGERTTIGAIHAVCVHPDRRGRGDMRALMEEALAWCDSRFETCALVGDPPLYERFGFRYVPEHRFVGPAPAGGVTRHTPPRVCDPADPADVELWRRLLSGREPVSNRAALVGEIDVFYFDAALLPIRYSAQLDALLDYECESGTLRLYDVVARSMPTLADIVAAVGAPVDRVEVYFTPDRLSADLTPEPWDLGPPDDPDTWMVRGPWIETPFMWPRTARW